MATNRKRYKIIHFGGNISFFVYILFIIAILPCICSSFAYEIDIFGEFFVLNSFSKSNIVVLIRMLLFDYRFNISNISVNINAEMVIP